MTPASLDYRFPAEWEPHAATWLAWPHRRQTWPGKFEPLPLLYQQLAQTLARFEPVHILAGGPAVMAEARRLVGDTPNVTLHDIPTNDAWIRDHGPMFLAAPAGQPPALVDWEFNAWGGKYPPWDADNAVPRQLADLLGRRRFTPGMILEGGSVDGNGAESILTSEQCLLNPNRNPQLSRPAIEQHLADYCGAKQVLWLGAGVVGDDTDGHVDELARFVNPTTIVAALEYKPGDVNYAALQDNFHRLELMTDLAGNPFDVIPLPMPQPIYHQEQRLPGSYCNFYLANGVVLVPQFDDPADAEMLSLFARLFPGRAAIGLPARDLVWGRGGFHCITQQQPA
jgi:agmatine deiminase